MLSPSEMPAALAGAPRPGAEGYFAFYSSLWDGIVTDPAWMVVPADDHVVHRGDGVFETVKCLDGGVYAIRDEGNQWERRLSVRFIPADRDTPMDQAAWMSDMGCIRQAKELVARLSS